MPLSSVSTLASSEQGWLGALSSSPRGLDLLQGEAMLHLLELSVKGANSEETGEISSSATAKLRPQLGQVPEEPGLCEGAKKPSAYLWQPEEALTGTKTQQTGAETKSFKPSVLRRAPSHPRSNQHAAGGTFFTHNIFPAIGRGSIYVDSTWRPSSESQVKKL